MVGTILWGLTELSQQQKTGVSDKGLLQKNHTSSVSGLSYDFSKNHI